MHVCVYIYTLNEFIYMWIHHIYDELSFIICIKFMHMMKCIKFLEIIYKIVFVFHFTFHGKHSSHLSLGVSQIQFSSSQVSFKKLDHRCSKLYTRTLTYTYVYIYIHKYIYTILIYKHIYIHTHTLMHLYLQCTLLSTIIKLNANFFLGLKRTLFSAEVEKQTREKWTIQTWAEEICILKMLWKKSVLP